MTKSLLRVEIARANDEQALVEIASMEGPYSLRVPVGELVSAPLSTPPPDARDDLVAILRETPIAGRLGPSWLTAADRILAAGWTPPGPKGEATQ